MELLGKPGGDGKWDGAFQSGHQGVTIYFKSGKGAAKPYKGKVVDCDILTELYTVGYDKDRYE